MKYENIKSVILAVLVIISALLTWSIWTFQPEYKTIENQLVHEVSIDNQKDVVALVKPYRILFHDDTGHYGTVGERQTNELITDMQKWTVYDIEPARVLQSQELNEITSSPNSVEIMYTSIVPFDVYKHAIQFEGKMGQDFSFDKIVVDFSEKGSGISSFYFVESATNKVYESHVNSISLTAFKDQILAELDTYQTYGPYVINADRTLFLPETEMALNSFKYYPEIIPPEKFKNALFNDPSFVTKDILPTSDEYTNGTSLMTVDTETNMISYVNPGQGQGMETEEAREGNGKSLIKRSIDFVNEHGGWTDNYRYFSLEPYENQVIFRLFMEGYPVFNESGMAEVVQYWGAEEIFKYIRPHFRLDLPLPTEAEKYTLPSGEDAVNILLKTPGIELDQLEDMMIGYEMSRDTESDKVLILEPSWYYRYANAWVRLPHEISGGEQDGLE